MEFKEKIKKYWHWPALIIMAVCFFVATSSYIYFVQADNFIKWSSPDETANYNFTKLYAQSGELKYFEKNNLIAEELIHPRSMRSDGGEVKPVSFLGIILIFGTIAHFLGYQVIPFLTPFFGALGIIFFFLLINKIFNQKIALISAFLLTIFPPYFYYSARSMFHNVLFMVLLIIGLYFISCLTKKYEGKKQYLNLLFAFTAGVFIGLTIITRTSEIIWLLPGLFLVWLFYLRQVGIAKLILFLAGIFLAILPVLYYNQILYSGIFNSGYTEANIAVSNITQATTNITQNAPQGRLLALKEQFLTIKRNVFYFGFNLAFAKKMFINYTVKMFNWLFWPAILGLIIFFVNFKKIKKSQLSLVASWALVSAILIIYYGSWKFNDNPDPSKFTIGNSYTRYWLPVYLGLMPFASYFLLKLARVFFPFVDSDSKHLLPFAWAKKHLALPRVIFLRAGFVALTLALVFSWASAFTLYGSEEGLFYSAETMRLARDEKNLIQKNTEDNAVIITFYADKILFPERRVIIGNLNDQNMNAIYAKLANQVPLYYYHFSLKPADVEYLNNTKFKDLNIQLKLVSKITKSFSLYKFEKTKK